MTKKQTAGPKAWASTLLLAGMGMLANNAMAQSPHSLVQSDSPTVTLDDQLPDFADSDIEQVGFLDGGHHSACDSCGQASQDCCCCLPWWAHRNAAFGEFLLLRPGNADQIYTIEQNDTTPGAFPTGPVGRANIDEEAAYRVGLTWAASECTSLVATWTKFEGDTANTIARTGTNVLNSQIIHPSDLTVGSASLQSSAALSLDFQLIDLAYRHIWKTSDIYAINWLAGFRYGNMEQDLLTQQDVSAATGLVTNDIDVDFNGFGMMFGVDGERRSACSGLMIYGKGNASFLAGDWKGTYIQTNQFGGGVTANSYEDYRVTPVVELELGFGWQSECGKWRATTGYLTSAWFDAISTREYVEAVRANDYVSVNETITFSGFTARLEGRF